LAELTFTSVTDLNEARDYLLRCQSKKLSWVKCVFLKLLA
jgi:hypothetical protein